MTNTNSDNSSDERRATSHVDLTTRIGPLTFKNPVTVASGTFGTKDEMSKYVDSERLGAIITKTISVKPRVGNDMPRIAETWSGMLNAIGLQNKGLDDFVLDKIPYFKNISTPLIVNVAGDEPGDFEILAKTLDQHKDVVKALELNLSCPNVEAGGTAGMKKREKIINVVKAVKGETDLPLFTKLSPELGDVLSIAGDLVKEGVLGFSLINTLKGMAIDIHTRKPRIANKTGGLSGPAIKPVALRYVYEVKKEFGVPVIASGGISNLTDALEFLIVGADLLAIGTANFVNPRATLDIIEALELYLTANNLQSLDEIRGSVVV